MSKQQNAILWPEGYTPGFTEISPPMRSSPPA